MADRSKSRVKVVVSKDGPPPPIPEKSPAAPEIDDEQERRPRSWVWLALGGAAVLALGLAAWHYITLYTSVDGARSDLVAVEEGLTEVGFAAEQSDLDEARDHLASAADNVDTAKAHFSYDPLIRLAGVLPGVGEQVDAASDLIDIADVLVEAGDHATVAAQKAIDMREDDATGEPLTQSLVGLLAETQPEMDEIQRLVQEAIVLRRELGDGDLWQPLNNARTHVDETLPGLAEGVDQLQRGSDLLPALLGFEGDRRYLVLALNNGELLPGGGLVTATGVMTVSQGVNGPIAFEDSNGWLPAAQAKGVPYIEPPGPLKRYLLRDYSWNLLVSNWDPDFPTWSQQALEFHEIVNGEQNVDGIVAVDLSVLEQLLTVTGPKTLDVPDLGPFEFTPENAVLELERMTRPAYVESLDDRKSIIGDLAAVLLADLLQLPSEQWAAAVRTVRRLGDQKHIQVYSFSEAEQALIRDVGWDGSLSEPASDYLHYNEASLLSTKLNLIVRPEGSLAIDVTELGDVEHELKLTYKNDLATWALDKDADLVQKLMLGGLYGGYLRVFAPAGMTNQAVDVDGSHGNIEDRGREGNAEWFGTMLPVAAGSTHEVAFRWRTTPPNTTASRYTLVIEKQPGTVGMCVDLSITRNGEPAEEITVEGGAQDPNGRWCLTTDMTVTARFE